MLPSVFGWQVYQEALYYVFWRSCSNIWILHIIQGWVLGTGSSITQKSHFHQQCSHRRVTPFIFLFRVSGRVRQFSIFFSLNSNTPWAFRQHFWSCLSVTWASFILHLWICSSFPWALDNSLKYSLSLFWEHYSWHYIPSCVAVSLTLTNQF